MKKHTCIRLFALFAAMLLILVGCKDSGSDTGDSSSVSNAIDGTSLAESSDPAAEDPTSSDASDGELDARDIEFEVLEYNGMLRGLSGVSCGESVIISTGQELDSRELSTLIDGRDEGFFDENAIIAMIPHVGSSSDDVVVDRIAASSDGIAVDATVYVYPISTTDLATHVVFVSVKKDDIAGLDSVVLTVGTEHVSDTSAEG